MQITLSNIGKRYNRDWIFRKVDCTFYEHKTYAITGPNGSGKSTLLQTVAGAVAASEGALQYALNGSAIEAENIFKYVAIAAPYLELIEEMTAAEFLSFHEVFKPFMNDLKVTDVLQIVEMDKAADKQIRFYSSGMKQRIKLAQAILSDVPLVLLDEPCTNLDTKGYDLYHSLVENYCKNKLVIVSSNDVNEYDFCEERISILDYK
jgi:ABC-type multidrug transport system ATPase subunit